MGKEARTLHRRLGARGSAGASLRSDDAGREDLTSRSDIELVELIRDGDSDAAFEVLEARYHELTRRRVSKIVRDQSDVEEVMQDVALTIRTKLGKFRGTCKYSVWLFRVVTNAAFMKLRYRRKHRYLLVGDLTPDDQRNHLEFPDTFPESDVGLQEEILTAAYALRKMYREVWLLKEVNGLSSEEAADALGLTVPAVKSRLYRAREFLRAKLRRRFEATTGRRLSEAA